MDKSQAKVRINGGLMANYQGKSACLLGKVIQADRSGMSFQMTTSDNQTVNVRMEEPLQELIHDLIEVHGTVTQKNEIRCSNYVLFPDSPSQNFDMESYDKAVRLMHRFPEHYIVAD